MKIEISIGEILDKYNWKVFCKIKWMNEWCISEGQVSKHSTIKLTLEEAEKIWIIINN